MPAHEWLKHTGRVEIFIEKYKKNDPFVMTDNSLVTFRQDAVVLENMENLDRKGINSMELVSVEGDVYKIKDIGKSPEFGGLGKGATAKVEDMALSSLKRKMKKLKKDSECLPINVMGDVYNVLKVESTPDFLKSDFHLIDERGEEVVWISHKDGQTAKDFQQWGGMSAAREGEISRHPEVETFIENLMEERPEGLESGDVFWRPIDDQILKNLSIYGNQYGQTLGRQNVSFVIQGAINLCARNLFFEFDGKIHYNGEDVGEDYDPVLYARFTRNKKYSGVENTRTMILPYGKLPSTAKEI